MIWLINAKGKKMQNVLPCVVALLLSKTLIVCEHFFHNGM